MPSQAMKDLISEAVGMPFDEIQDADIDVIHKSIEKKIGKKLKLGFEPKIRYISREQIEADFEKYFPRGRIIINAKG